MALECPRCGLLNPADARRCDCDYDMVARPTPTVPKVTPRALLFSLEGRVSLSTYWLRFSLPYVAIYLLLLLCDSALEKLASGGAVGLLSGTFIFISFYPCIAVGVKRCHDRDRSGWFLLVGLVPILHLWPAIELGFFPGTPGPNRYGLPSYW